MSNIYDDFKNKLGHEIILFKKKTKLISSCKSNLSYFLSYRVYFNYIAPTKNSSGQIKS